MIPSTVKICPGKRIDLGFLIIVSIITTGNKAPEVELDAGSGQVLEGAFDVDECTVESAFMGLRVVEKIKKDRKYSMEE